MQVSSFGKNRKQSLYIQLGWVIHGKPSGKKKQRTGSVNYPTEYGLPWVELWLLLGNEQFWGRTSKGQDQKVWRVRNRREGVQIGLRLNSANRRKRQRNHTVINVNELWRSVHGQSPQVFFMIIMWPHFRTKCCWSVCYSLGKCYIVSRLGIHLYFCDDRRVGILSFCFYLQSDTDIYLVQFDSDFYLNTYKKEYHFAL